MSSVLSLCDCADLRRAVSLVGPPGWALPHSAEISPGSHSSFARQSSTSRDMLRSATATTARLSRSCVTIDSKCSLLLPSPCPLARLPHTRHPVRALATAPGRTAPKHRPELSRNNLPELNEEELEETWVRGQSEGRWTVWWCRVGKVVSTANGSWWSVAAGSGPGGQSMSVDQTPGPSCHRVACWCTS